MTASTPKSTPRARAAAALRRLGHAVVGHEADPLLLERIAELADRTAATVEAERPRGRPVLHLKRRLWESPPADGLPMSHFDECVVSGRENPMGIAIEVRREGDVAVAEFVLGAAFEGAPQRAHGGIVASIADDIMGYVLALHRTPAYTGRLTVHYRAPAPLRTPLRARAWLDRRQGRKLWIASEIVDGETLIAEGEGLFIAIPPERFSEG